MSIDLWGRSGARALTAHAGNPPGDPARRAAGITQRIHDLTGGTVDLDGPAELTLRAHLNPHTPPPLAGFTLRRAGHMMRCSDGWVAAQMPRPSDRELVPALTAGAIAEPTDPTTTITAFDALADWISTQPRAAVLDTAQILGFPLVAVPEPHHPLSPNSRSAPWQLSDTRTPTPSTPCTPRTQWESLRVADLSSLWAGPLAGAILATAGAQVTRYESAHRPETPLPEDLPFTHRLNGQKTHTRFDFNDRARLHTALRDADILITSARPRALERLGIRRHPHQLWVRITAYGHHGPHADRAGFGDDAAAAAGAVSWHNGQPSFAADALADPLTGLLAAEAALRLTQAGITGTVDLSLYRSARWAIRPTDGIT